MWRKKGREVERRISRGEGEKSDLIESLPRIIRSMKLKPTTQISCEPKLDRAQARLSPGIQLWGRTIGAVCGNLLQSCGLAGTRVEGKMSEEHFGGHAECKSARSSRGSTWRERRQKRHEDQERELAKGQSGLGEGSYQTLRTVLGAMEHDQHDERDQEIEQLRRLVKDFELEGRNRHQRRNQYN